MLKVDYHVIIKLFCKESLPYPAQFKERLDDVYGGVLPL